MKNGSSAALAKVVKVSHTAKASFLEEKKQTNLIVSGNEFADVIFVLLQRHLYSYHSTLSGVFQLLLQKKPTGGNSHRS